MLVHYLVNISIDTYFDFYDNNQKLKTYYIMTWIRDEILDKYKSSSTIVH